MKKNLSNYYYCGIFEDHERPNGERKVHLVFTEKNSPKKPESRKRYKRIIILSESTKKSLSEKVTKILEEINF